MKHYQALFLAVCVLLMHGYAQLPAPAAPKLEFANKHSLIFQVGQKLIFRQTYTQLVDTIVTEGEIVFSHSYINQIPCYQSIYLKDTVLVSQMIEITGKKNIHAFWMVVQPYFKEYSVNQFNKKRFYYNQGMWGNKKIAYTLVLNGNTQLTFTTQLVDI